MKFNIRPGLMHDVQRKIVQMPQQSVCEAFSFDAQCAIKGLHRSYRFADNSKVLDGPKPNRPGSELRQARICHSERCTHRLSILSLPTSVRQQIYSHAGLIHDQHVYLQKDYELQQSYLATIKFRTRQDYQTTLNLLLTSHAIYHEVHPIVYSTNTFFVRYLWTGGLTPIHYLPPKALSTITKLVVFMNQSSCDSRGCCGPNPDARPDNRSSCVCCNAARSPFSLPEDKQAITEWHVTARYLSTHIAPSRLNFVFICDVGDLETGKMAVNPFKV